MYGPVAAIVESGGESWIAWLRDAGFAVVLENELGGRRWNGVVLDDYNLQPADVGQWRKRVAGPVVQIVDHQPPLPGVDLAVNATAGRSGNRIGDTPALLGASYAMLAAPYRGRPKPTIRPCVQCVLVGVGWVDTQNATERVLAALKRAADQETRVDVMLSSASSNIAAVTAIIASKPQWQLHQDVKEPWTLLEGADIAISAAGQGLLERLAFGIPTLAMVLAVNQEPAFAGVAAAGAAYNLGRLAELSEEKIASDYAALAGDAKLRSKLSAAAQRLVDGHGAERVAQHLVAMAKKRSAAEVSQ